jgi:predicted ATPase
VGLRKGPLASEGAPGGGVIWTPDQRLRVFVSSTLGELPAERQAVRDALTGLRLVPVMFELGARPHPPRDVYRAYLAQSQVFVGIYWQSYGWVAPGEQISGLEDEYQLSAGLPRLIYMKSPAPEQEPRLADLLARIQDEGGVSYQHFSAAAELRQLVADDLAVLLSERFAASAAARAAPRREGERGPRPLPAGTTSLVGREQAIGQVAGMLTMRPGGRLVTLTGPGGVGKTRLALAVAGRQRDRFGARMVFVPLAAVTDPQLVLSGISRALGADLMGAGPPLQALADQLGDDAWLLILDNLEQVAQAAGGLGELLARCPGVAILATSRAVLGLRAEREYPVPPLPLPADPATASLGDIVASPAVALFIDRARTVRPGFALTLGNAAAVAEICRRLEGLPLAIELAAARTRLLDPGALPTRLAKSLDALGTGAVDLPERQQTLRATVEWSVGLLTDAERSLLEVAAVFTDGWTVEAAATVAGLEEDQVLELTEALVRHSLVQLDPASDGPRCWMLETVRVFVAERLAARADAAEVQRRHAGYYRALAGQAEPYLRGVGQGEWLDRLQAEVGNLAVAVDWYLSHDRALLPRLFRVLLTFWLADDILGQARAWISQLLPAAGSLDPQARAELLWAAAATANMAGDNAAALAASQRLGPLLAEIRDPYLHAVSQLAMAWASTIAGDSDGAFRQASASLEELRSQDEPYLTAVAVFTVGDFEKTAGRYDDAQRHLSEAHALAERFGYAWLATISQAQLGTLAVARGRLGEARALLNERLAVSLAAYSTQNVAAALAAFAQLAFAEGDLERAALLAGAAEGLRRRADLAAWPAVLREEADLAAQIRQALGADRFDQAYAAGTRLNRRDAIAAARASAPARAPDALTGPAAQPRITRRLRSPRSCWISRRDQTPLPKLIYGDPVWDY